MGRRPRRPRAAGAKAPQAAPAAPAARSNRRPPASARATARPAADAREDRAVPTPPAADAGTGARALRALARWLCRPGRRRCADGDVHVDVDGQGMLRCLLCMATTSSGLEVPDWGSALEAALGEQHVRTITAEVGGPPHFHRVCRWEASVCTRAYRTARPDRSADGVGHGGEALWQLPEVPPDGVRVTLQLRGMESAKLCIGAGPAAVVEARSLGPPGARAAERGAAGPAAAYRLQAFWDIQPHGGRRRELDQQELPASSLAPGTYSLRLTSHNSRALFTARPVFGASFLAAGRADHAAPPPPGLGQAGA